MNRLSSIPARETGNPELAGVEEGAEASGDGWPGEVTAGGAKQAYRSKDEQAARLIQGDVQRLPFAENAFDRVIDCETIEHVPDDQGALREMYRVTRPGGKLLPTTPNCVNLTGIYDVYAKLRQPGGKHDQPFDRQQSFVHILRRIRSAG